jgi:hypothetical protein
MVFEDADAETVEMLEGLLGNAEWGMFWAILDAPDLTLPDLETFCRNAIDYSYNETPEIETLRGWFRVFLALAEYPANSQDEREMYRRLVVDLVKMICSFRDEPEVVKTN